MSVALPCNVVNSSLNAHLSMLSCCWSADRKDTTYALSLPGNIGFRPLVSIQLCLVLQPPSSSSCTYIRLSTFLPLKSTATAFLKSLLMEAGLTWSHSRKMDMSNKNYVCWCVYVCTVVGHIYIDHSNAAASTVIVWLNARWHIRHSMRVRNGIQPESLT